jgi:hypothetical protein
MSETILVFDNDNFDRAKANATQIVDAGSNAVFVHNGVDYDCAGIVRAQQSRQVDLVLFHQRNQTELNAAGVFAPCRISYSGGLGADIPRAISHDGLTPDEARHIVTQVRSEASEIRERILAYWTDRGNILALKLLCEAYALHPVGVGRKSFTSQTSGAPPIVVNCPDPSTWFDLIDSSKPTGEEKQKEATFTAFGRLMGDAGNEAIALARAILEPGSDITEPAARFVEKVAMITVNQVGGAK